MNSVVLLFDWLFSILLSLLAISLILMGGLLQAIALLGLVTLLLPPLRTFLHRKTGKKLPVPMRALLIVALLALFIVIGTVNKPQSIYNSSETEAKLMAMYDAKLEQWPDPYESVFLYTAYGTFIL